MKRTVKRLLVDTIAAAVILVVGLVGTFLALTKSDEYTEVMKVVDVQEDVVSFECEHGYIFEWCGIGFNVGDRYKVKMNDHGTESPFDDEIIEFKKLETIENMVIIEEEVL